MSRTWKYDGPEDDTLTVEAAARLFGYEWKNLRVLIAAGRFLRPRGYSPHQYYTGGDIAIIREILGRWGPDAKGGKKDGSEENDDEV